MTAVDQITTAEQLLKAPGLGRCELLRGELIMMSPAGCEHGRVVVRLTGPLFEFVERHSLGVVYGAETGRSRSRQGTVPGMRFGTRTAIQPPFSLHRRRIPRMVLAAKAVRYPSVVLVAEDEGRSIDSAGTGSSLIPGRPGVLPKELPHQVVGGDVPRGLPKALDSRLSARPRVTTALDDEQDHL